MTNIFYWSPFISKVATVKAVINSAQSLNEYSDKNFYNTSIIDAVGEWSTSSISFGSKNSALVLGKFSR